jgi:hypothetical protein
MWTNYFPTCIDFFNNFEEKNEDSISLKDLIEENDDESKEKKLLFFSIGTSGFTPAKTSHAIINHIKSQLKLYPIKQLFILSLDQQYTNTSHRSAFEDKFRELTEYNEPLMLDVFMVGENLPSFEGSNSELFKTYINLQKKDSTFKYYDKNCLLPYNTIYTKLESFLKLFYDSGFQIIIENEAWYSQYLVPTFNLQDKLLADLIELGLKSANEIKYGINFEKICLLPKILYNLDSNKKQLEGRIFRLLNDITFYFFSIYAVVHDTRVFVDNYPSTELCNYVDTYMPVLANSAAACGAGSRRRHRRTSKKLRRTLRRKY